MDAPGGRVDLLGQLVGVGALELGEATVLEDQSRQCVRAGQLLEHVLGRGWLAGGGFPCHRQPEFLEQDLLQLLGRIEVERAAGLAVRLELDLLHALRQFLALPAQQLPVDEYAGALHVAEHLDQRRLELAVERLQAGLGVQRRPQRRVQAQRHVRVLRGVRCCHVDRHLIERELPDALAGNVLEADGVETQVVLRERVHVVPRGNAVEHIGFEHRIVDRTLQRDAMVEEDVAIVLDVVPDLRPGRIFQQRTQALEYPRPIQLVGRPRVIMGDRHVGGAARGRRERQADHVGDHVVQAGCFGIDRKERRRLQFRDQVVEFGARQHRPVVPFRLGLQGRRRGACGASRSGVRRGRQIGARQRPQQRTKFQAPVDRGERRVVLRPPAQLGNRRIEGQVQVDRREPARQLEFRQVLTQAFTDLALDVGGMGHERIQGAVLAEPPGGRLRPDLRHARDVVGAVADQCQVVDDLARLDVELLLHPGQIEPAARHGVDAGDVGADELRHVLVAGRDHDVKALLRCLPRERADDVVGLDTDHPQQRQTEGGHGFQHRLDLRAQLVRHRRPVRLVGLEQVVAERPARRIEDDRNALGLIVLQELDEHVDDAEDRTGGLALRVRQRWQRVECPVQVGRTVDQIEDGSGHRRQCAAASPVAGTVTTAFGCRSGSTSAPFWPQPANSNRQSSRGIVRIGVTRRRRPAGGANPEYSAGPRTACRSRGRRHSMRRHAGSPATVAAAAGRGCGPARPCRR